MAENTTLKMVTKSLNKIDLPDGNYKGRLGGKTVVIRHSDKTIKFDVNYDCGALSIGVWVTIKKGYATVTSTGYY